MLALQSRSVDLEDFILFCGTLSSLICLIVCFTKYQIEPNQKYHENYIPTQVILYSQVCYLLLLSGVKQPTSTYGCSNLFSYNHEPFWLNLRYFSRTVAFFTFINCFQNILKITIDASLVL